MAEEEEKSIGLKGSGYRFVKEKIEKQKVERQAKQEDLSKVYEKAKLAEQTRLIKKEAKESQKQTVFKQPSKIFRRMPTRGRLPDIDFPRQNIPDITTAFRGQEQVIMAQQRPLSSVGADVTRQIPIEHDYGWGRSAQRSTPNLQQDFGWGRSSRPEQSRGFQKKKRKEFDFRSVL